MRGAMIPVDAVVNRRKSKKPGHETLKRRRDQKMETKPKKKTKIESNYGYRCVMHF